MRTDELGWGEKEYLIKHFKRLQTIFLVIEFYKWLQTNRPEYEIPKLLNSDTILDDYHLIKDIVTGKKNMRNILISDSRNFDEYSFQEEQDLVQSEAKVVRNIIHSAIMITCHTFATDKLDLYFTINLSGIHWRTKYDQIVPSVCHVDLYLQRTWKSKFNISYESLADSDVNLEEIMKGYDQELHRLMKEIIRKDILELNLNQ
jgi:hypothetical protein